MINRDAVLDFWCICPATAIADAQNYYTKKQVDDIVIESGGMTSGIVQSMIEEYTYDKLTIDYKIATVQESVYNKQEMDVLLGAKNDVISVDGMTLIIS
jgi:hypothetical protein